MKTLYIVGNGFDKAHGLKTSYWDFRCFLDEKYPEFLYQFEKMYNIEPMDPTEYGYSLEAQERWDKNVNHTLWSEFENEIGHPDIEEMIGFSTCILNDLDLETGNIGIEDTMNEYWQSEYGFIKNFPQYVKEWISTVDTTSVIPQKRSLIGNDNDLFFCFNYTDTLENVYKIESVMHIHGSIASDFDLEPIMGHCNSKDIRNHLELHYEAQEQFDEGESSIHNAVADYLKILFKDTKHIIELNNWFFQAMKNVNRVVIIGWSAGDVDIPYLVEIKKWIDKSAKWFVYYYDDKAKESIENALKKTEISSSFPIEYLPALDFWNE